MIWDEERFFVMPNGKALARDECRPCSCGCKIKHVTEDQAYCPRCVRPKPGEVVLGWLDCDEKVYHRGRPPR